jgi:hypothetical protein
LIGLEEVNNNMQRRGIVMHGAKYSREPMNYSDGKYRLGCSHGCPSIDDRESKYIIDKIRGGTAVFIYSGDDQYAQKSLYLNEQDAQYTFSYLIDMQIAQAKKQEREKKS